MIGRGGMGEVYLARRTTAPTGSEPIVVKRMRPEIAQEAKAEHLKRLVFEAQVAARLSHPNLVRLLEFGKVGDCHYLAMEYVRGWTLKRLLDDVFETDLPPPTGVGLAVACGILDGLSAMHRAREDDGALRPILHRDVTPHNVIVTHEGRPMLIDFGIAKDVLGPQITMVGNVIGTAPYMAPEHRVGGFIDPRADVFSAGVLLFELLTARHPWPRMNSMKELLRIVFDPPELKPELLERLPADVLPIVLKGVACDPAARYPDAVAMLEDIKATNSYQVMRGFADSDWGAVSSWVDRLALAPDEALEGLVIDHRALVDPAAQLTWNSSGELAPEGLPEPSTADIMVNSSVLTIPPLPPRRETSIAVQELHEVSAYTEQLGRARWTLVAAGVLLFFLVGLGVFLASGH
jgi:serine/threonine protein kinase